MLVRQVRPMAADPTARSFRVVGDDFYGLTFADLREAAAACDEAVRAVPEHSRDAVVRQHEAHAREVHVVLRSAGRDVYCRARGYLAVARRTGSEVIWPTIAALGVSQILDSARTFRAVSLVGEWACALGYDGLSELSAAIDDAVRRANRVIFADSIATSLVALRCVALRRRGLTEVADALLVGPPPPTMDEQSWGTVRALDEAARIDDGAERFRLLRDLAFEEFEREQAALTYHLDGTFELRGAPDWVRKRLRLRSAIVPAIEGARGRRRLVFTKHPLPEDFDFSDHRARVDGPGRAFFDAATHTEDDFREVVAYVLRRFEPGERLTAPAGCRS
jgi:hypothetical protein